MDKKIIVNRIHELMEEKHISNYSLKENAEISSTVYQWRKNTTRDATRTPSLRSIEKICSFLGVSLSHFFAFNSDEQDKLKDEELLSLLQELDKEERNALIVLIHSFKKHHN